MMPDAPVSGARELPHDAIASDLGISVTAAKVRLHRGRKRLRDLVYGADGVEGGRSTAEDDEDERGTRHGARGRKDPAQIPRGYFKVAQLKHTGDPKLAPKAMHNLMDRLNKEYGLDVVLQTKFDVSIYGYRYAPRYYFYCGGGIYHTHSYYVASGHPPKSDRRPGSRREWVVRRAPHLLRCRPTGSPHRSR